MSIKCDICKEERRYIDDTMVCAWCRQDVLSAQIEELLDEHHRINEEINSDDPGWAARP